MTREHLLSRLCVYRGGMLKEMKDFFVTDAAKFDNELVTSFFVLSSIQMREKKQGGQYLSLTLADKTGTLAAAMWENFEAAASTCSDGCYVKVQGRIGRYQGKFQLSVQQMRLAAGSEIEPGDYQPTTRFDVDEMWAELRSHVYAFENGDLKRLVFAFLDDEEIAAAYKTAPAAMRLHHAWLGGLLEHVLALVRVCLAAAPCYPEIDRDLLVTGAILHDIGKTRELGWKSSFNYTLEGQMIGHINIAQGMLREKIQSIAPFPERLRVLVEHMILSHHGKYEFGSPKLPMTPEALLLSTLDDLEAKIQAMRNAFDASTANGRSAGEVTEWVRSLDRPVLNSRAYLKGE